MRKSQAPSRNPKRAKTTPRKRVNMNVPRSLGFSSTGLPKQLKQRLKYVQNLTGNTTAGVVPNTSLFSTNGAYDPWISGVGHQPMYFDQLMALYNQYTITGSVMKMEVTFQNQNTLVTSVTQTMTCGIYIEDDTTITPTSWSGMVEQPSATSKDVAQNSGTVTLWKRWSAYENFGPGTQSNSEMRGNAATNPTEQQFFCCFWQAQPVSESIGYTATITIEYDCVFDERRNLISS